MNKRVTVEFSAGGMVEVRHVYEGRVIEETDDVIVIKSGRYPWTFFKSAPYVTIEDETEYQYGILNTTTGHVTKYSEDLARREAPALARAGFSMYKLVRREVGEWEEE